MSARTIPRWFVFVLVVFVAASCFAAWWVFVPPSREVLDRKLDELRAAGFPMRPSEVPGAVVPEEQNGAAELQAAWKWLLDNRDPARSVSDPWPVVGPWSYGNESWRETASPDELAALAKWLEEQRPFFDRVDAALTRPALRWPLSDDPGGGSGYEWIATQQSVTRLLRASSMAAGTPEERLASSLRLIRLGERMGICSGMGSVIGMTTVRAGFGAILMLAQEQALPAATLRRALEGEKIAERLPQVGAFLRAEVAYWAWQASSEVDFRDLRRDMGMTPRQPHPAEFAETLETMRCVCELDTSDFLAASSRVTELRTTRPSDQFPLPGALRGAARMDAALRLLRVALVATERRERGGAWPSSLDVLAPEFGGAVPLDPLSGKPFRYEVKDGVATFTTSSDGRANDANTLKDWEMWGLIIEIPR